LRHSVAVAHCDSALMTPEILCKTHHVNKRRRPASADRTARAANFRLDLEAT